jgi:hypothetical protein
VTVQGITAAPAPQVEAAGGSMPTTGRWGWYQDHDGATYRRTSTLVKEVETDTYNLDLWKLRQVLVGAARRGDLITAVKAMGDPDPKTGWTRAQKKLIDELVEKASEAAKVTDGAITGTAVHTLTERIDRGEPIGSVLAAELPADVAQGLLAYAKLRELNGWRSVEIERTVVLDELEVAGTFDRVDYLPELTALLGPGTCQHEGADWHEHHTHAELLGDDLPVTVDVKTEKDPTLNGLHIGPQLAIYSRARRMWRPTGGTHDLIRGGEIVRYGSGDAVQVPNGEYVPAPCVRQDVAVVVHIFDGDANPLLLNLAEGWSAAVAAYEQVQRKARAKRKIGAQGAWFAPLPTKRPSRLTSFVEHAAAQNYADPNRPGPGQVATDQAYGALAEHMATGGSTTEGVGAALAGATAIACGPPSFGVDGSTIATAQPMSDGRTHYSVSTITPAPPAGAGQEAMRGPDGMVRWEDRTAAEMMGLPGADEAARKFDEKDELRRLLIDAIWQARTIDALAILWKMANDRGVPWSGPVAMAGDARRRQIECPQRALHNGSGKCACGWMAGQVA